MRLWNGHYREYRPSARLAPFVRGIFIYRSQGFVASLQETPPIAVAALSRELCLAPGAGEHSAMFANGNVSVVVNHGDGYRIDGLWEPRHAQPHVIGAVSRAHASHYGPGLAQIGAYLRPGASLPLLGVPPIELADRVLPLHGLTGIQLDIDLTQSDSTCLARFEASFRPRTENLRLPPIAAQALHRIRTSGGAISLGSLARDAGVSRQFLSSAFHQAIGIGPKLYAELTRFEHVLHAATGAADWAQTAMGLGYSDQSHLIAHFRRFTGTTPARFVRERQFHPFHAA